MMKLIIDRDIWLRGEGSGWSYLLRKEDEKMCCLGIYLKECGVSSEKLLDMTSPCQLVKIIPPEAEWLIDKSLGIDSMDTCDLMGFNDRRKKKIEKEDEKEDEREEKIAHIFAKHNIEVEFVN